MGNAIDWVLNRLKERSTWAGIVSLAGAVGLSVAPELSEQIITAGLALVGIVAAILKDRDSPDAS